MNWIRSRTGVLIGFAALAFLVWGCQALPLNVSRDGKNPADLVVMNALVFTSNPDAPFAEAVAVRGERICYVGRNRGAAEYVGPETRLVNAEGRMLVPGFVDDHCHVLWMGALQALMTDLYGAPSLKKMQAAVTDYAANNPKAPFVMGIGWRYDYIPNGMPDKALADSILKDRPLFLWSYDGHTGWVNSMALEWMQKKNPEAFRQLTPQMDEKTKQPTGVLLHFYAFNPFDYFAYDELSPDIQQKMFDAMTKVLDGALSVGVTTVNDVQIYKTFLPILSKFKDQGGFAKIRARGTYYISHYALQNEDGLTADLKAWKEFGKQQSNAHLFLGDSVKLYMDGVFGSHTAFMLAPYSDKPGDCGHALWSQEDFNRVTEIVDDMGLQACTHGIGDAAIRRIINGYAHARRLHGVKDSRHRIEHCELPEREDRRRIAELGIYAAMQPAHFYGDKTVEKTLGRKRLQWLMPWKSLEVAGVEMSFGSDWCAGPINPIYGLLLASTRMNYKGKRSWGPDQKIQLSDAIRHWTIGSAKALRLDKELGAIEVGKYGDFALFSTNLLDIDSAIFLLTHKLELGCLDDFVVMTVVGGKIVYYRKGEKL